LQQSFFFFCSHVNKDKHWKLICIIHINKLDVWNVWLQLNLSIIGCIWMVKQIINNPCNLILWAKIFTWCCWLCCFIINQVSCNSRCFSCIFEYCWLFNCTWFINFSNIFNMSINRHITMTTSLQSVSPSSVCFEFSPLWTSLVAWSSTLLSSS